ncbi:MAG TPA: hypothetical protein VHN14_37120 [Kofleriaceae bacterium]|jgi:hypothetical protein|nr:hypothetical protein [Kofleriaceae bacterium]
MLRLRSLMRNAQLSPAWGNDCLALNTIVHAHDQRASEDFFAEVFGLPKTSPFLRHQPEGGSPGPEGTLGT